MDRNHLINSLVNRKLTAATKGKPICVCMAGPSKTVCFFMAGPSNAAPKK